MAYKPNRFHNLRDETYPSEIASQRPALASRFQCSERAGLFGQDAEASLRGSRHHDVPSPHYDEMEDCEDMVGRFNFQLRSGHGYRNAGDE
jgi:hypothetical protein